MPADSIRSILNLIEENGILFIDLRLTDMIGQEHHFTIPARQANEQLFTQGKFFDGSSFKGWKQTECSDMVLIPNPESAFIDPLAKYPTLVLVCDVVEPDTMDYYVRDPRALAKRAEEYLKQSQIADHAFFGPENEFFIFDKVRYSNDPYHMGYELNSSTCYWDSQNPESYSGHFAEKQEGYSPLQPVDKLHDIRNEIVLNVEKTGLDVEIHHREVASAGQCEIGVKFNTLLKKSDEVQRLKYLIKNTVDQLGKSATFLPKPYFGESGSGMHVHISLFKDGKNIFCGEEYSNLSETALYFIGGIIKHARALNAFTNASTNSYKRLIPHYEAPVLLAYSAKNRTASIRIPYIVNENARRIEIRFPDATANPYFAFSALLMAGLDGIENKIHPGPAFDENLYELSNDLLKSIPKVCRTLDEALEALDKDRAFLLKGGVFNDSVIDAYIKLKQNEINQVAETPHPMEYKLYYSI
nr:type I glutamate--ammonia ligase [Ignatzschineria rhizosphaerae]